MPSTAVPTAPQTRPRRAPRPRGAPLVGSLLDLRRDPLGALLEARRTDGDVVRFVLGPPGARLEFYAVFHPDAVQRVLAREADRFRKDNVFYEEARWALGDGLLNSQDGRWLRQKRLLQPLFTRRRLDDYVPIMAREAARVVESWRPVAARGATVDLHDAMIGLSLRVVASALFGTDAERAMPVVRSALPTIGEYTIRRGFAPVRTSHAWPTPANRRVARARAAIHAVCDELIAARRASPTGGRDLLGLLLEADDGTLRDGEIRDQVLIFLLAGHETSGLALTFALDLLGRHPHVQRQVRQEVADVLGDRVPDARDVAALASTTLALKEAMRLFPPAWGFGRRTPTGDALGGFDVPPGADVYVFPWVTHRHPELWPEPDSFDPTRFAPELEAGRHPYAYLPFGGGPRGCIGRHFAMLEAVTALALIVRSFEVTALGSRVPLAARLTLQPAAPVLARLEPAGHGAGRAAPPSPAAS